jgi:hypothetical protein
MRAETTFPPDLMELTMRTLFRTHSSLPPLGMTSLVLGIIAMLLGFLPVLGIPLSACGIILGVIGFGAALCVGGSNLRWGLAGLAASCLALGLNVAIAYAPGGYLPDHNVPKPWQPVPDQPEVPPPAR